MAAPARSATPTFTSAEVGIAVLGLSSLLGLINTVIVLPRIGISAAIWAWSTFGFFYAWRRVVQSSLPDQFTPSLTRVIRNPRMYQGVSWPTALVVLHLSVGLLFAVLYAGYLAGAVFETPAQFGVFTVVFVPAIAAVIARILYRPVSDVVEGVS